MEIIEKIKRLFPDGTITVTVQAESEYERDNAFVGIPTTVSFTGSELQSLVTLIEQQSAVIEEAEKALEQYAERDVYSEDYPFGSRIADQALARIQHIQNKENTDAN